MIAEIETTLAELGYKLIVLRRDEYSAPPGDVIHLELTPVWGTGAPISSITLEGLLTEDTLRRVLAPLEQKR